MVKVASRLVLHGLVALGLWSSARLAWRQWSTGEACPILGTVPACYVAFVGYAAMAGALVLVGRSIWARRSFFAGVAVAGGLALLGAALELVQGHVCPRAGGVPMCYVSLGMSILMGVLFWRQYGAAARPDHGSGARP
jgi:hypothetical protein